MYLRVFTLDPIERERVYGSIDRACWTIYICTGPSLVGDLPPSIPCDQLAPPPKEAVVEQFMVSGCRVISSHGCSTATPPGCARITQESKSSPQMQGDRATVFWAVGVRYAKYTLPLDWIERKYT